ncbi:response regulator transcription factor [Cohnella candidum]|uniref:DNA-binding response regulator n=1 Tax=Cohnella candidum TaxID=2674991 RepID=A0A3G3JSI4_9BACL|nr:response regulator transcription factor [Cohnella candidum]AYQ71164.1 DNA-binding response regulator [Cohnella candidum]
MRVLVVEDDESLLRIIRDIFQGESFVTDVAETGDDGYYLAEQGIHDLIVLDVMLPGMTGIEIVKRLRARSVMTPIILLTAKDALADRVAGLDAGADDYVTKPFAVSELLARSRAVLRRQGTIGQEGDLTGGPIRLSPSARAAYCGEAELHLTAKEFELLEFFLCHKDRILTREQIFDRVWGFESEAVSNAVDAYVHLLRKKLASHGAETCLRTVRGVGYMFRGDPDVQ